MGVAMWHMINLLCKTKKNYWNEVNKRVLLLKWLQIYLIHKRKCVLFTLCLRESSQSCSGSDVTEKSDVDFLALGTS